MTSRKQKMTPSIKDTFTELYRLNVKSVHGITEYDPRKRITTEYDFQRRVAVYTKEGSSHWQIIPFSQLDNEILTFMRDTLIKKGGNPPELPLDNTTRGGLFNKPKKNNP